VTFEDTFKNHLTSDLGTQSLDNGIVSVSDACEVFLQSMGGNLTVAIPSCIIRTYCCNAIMTAVDLLLPLVTSDRCSHRQSW